MEKQYIFYDTPSGCATAILGGIVGLGVGVGLCWLYPGDWNDERLIPATFAITSVLGLVPSVFVELSVKRRLKKRSESRD